MVDLMKFSLTARHLTELPPLIALDALLCFIHHQDNELEINFFPAEPVLLSEVLDIEVSVQRFFKRVLKVNGAVGVNK